MDNKPIPTFASCGFVAHLAGVTPQTVRNYVKHDLIKPSARVCMFGDDKGVTAVFSAADINGVVETIQRYVNFEKANPEIFGGKSAADLLDSIEASKKATQANESK